MALWEKQALFTKNVASLIKFIDDHDHYATLGEAFRTQEQAKIYERTGKGILNSLHCKRLAIDINLINSEGKYLVDSSDYRKFGLYWESLHPSNRWGGMFKRPDGNHFEMKDE